MIVLAPILLNLHFFMIFLFLKHYLSFFSSLAITREITEGDEADRGKLNKAKKKIFFGRIFSLNEL
jgi:hypothetical protein